MVVGTNHLFLFFLVKYYLLDYNVFIFYKNYYLKVCMLRNLVIFVIFFTSSVLLDASQKKDKSHLICNEINGVVYDKKNRIAFRTFNYGFFFLTRDNRFIFFGSDRTLYEIDPTDASKVFVYDVNYHRLLPSVSVNSDDEFKMYFDEVTRFKGQMSWWKDKWDKVYDRENQRSCCPVS